MTPTEILTLLHHRGLIIDPGASCTSLGGGVSSDIWLIDDGHSRFVVKRALPKLRVAQDWYADVSRNRHEQDYIDYVSQFLPDAVPHILHREPEHGFFTMEYFGMDYHNWKNLLMAGKPEIDHAQRAATTLATIHRHSWNDPEVRARFATTPQFFQLRLEPYLLRTGERHPALQAYFAQEADRLAATSLCLVHGDFSPKNILIGQRRMVILDCEVAWFGDPAFDIAFLLNHFFLKALLLHQISGRYLALTQQAWKAYQAIARADQLDGLEERMCRILLMLMLARVDGKSPVEYLTDKTQQDCVRTFVGGILPGMDGRLDNLCRSWQIQIKERATCQKAP